MSLEDGHRGPSERRSRDLRQPGGPGARGPTEAGAEHFSLPEGGPFHALLGRLGLLGDDHLPTLRAAIGWALLAWLPPALTVVVQSSLDARHAGWDFFADGTAWSRYLIAVVAMISTERYADGRIRILVGQFREAQIIGPDSLPAFSRALASADRLSSSALAEAAILTFALVWPGVSSSYAVAIAGSSWEGTATSGAGKGRPPAEGSSSPGPGTLRAS